MAHIPPVRSTVPAPADPPPIIIQGVRRGPGQGDADTIEINLPQFSFVNTTMSIELSGNEGLAKVKSEATKLPNETTPIPPGRKFKSKITRIVLDGVQAGSGGALEFRPNASGNCKIEIFFGHPD